MGTRGYAAYRQAGDDGVMAVSFRDDADPPSLGEAMAAVARRRATDPSESLAESMEKGLAAFLAETHQSLAGAGTVPSRNFLHDEVYCEYAYVIDVDAGRFEAWWLNEAWCDTDTDAARQHPEVAARHPHRCLLGVFPLDVPADWVAATGWPGRYRKG